MVEPICQIGHCNAAIDRSVRLGAVDRNGDAVGRYKFECEDGHTWTEDELEG